MELISLFFKTILFRPYVFVFLAAFLFSAIMLIGWPRTWRFWLISWATAFVCEFSSTRNGIPFGWYHYNGSTVGPGALLLQRAVHGLDLVQFSPVSPPTASHSVSFFQSRRPLLPLSRCSNRCILMWVRERVGLCSY